MLAVGTAGALIRRDVWERLGGLDPAWSTYGDDVDLGWRINAAGGRVVVATRAVVRHVRAQTVGRRTSATVEAGRRLSSGAGRACRSCCPTPSSGWCRCCCCATSSAACSARSACCWSPAALRRPGPSCARWLGVLTHPRVVTTGRRDRSSLREVPHRDLRHLFPSASARWRSSPLPDRPARQRPGRRVRGLRRVRDRAGRRRRRSRSTPATARSRRSSAGPGTILFLVMSLLALVAERHLLSTLAARRPTAAGPGRVQRPVVDLRRVVPPDVGRLGHARTAVAGDPRAAVDDPVRQGLARRRPHRARAPSRWRRCQRLHRRARADRSRAGAGLGRRRRTRCCPR